MQAAGAPVTQRGQLGDGPIGSRPRLFAWGQCGVCLRQINAAKGMDAQTRRNILMRR